MDVEETLWAIFAGIVVVIFGMLLAYGIFIAGPERDQKITLCERAGGVAVTDDGRYRFCVDANVVIQIDMPEGQNDAN